MDEVHPFSDTTGVDVVLRDAKNILSPNLAVRPKNAARIWGFILNFVMVDQFVKTLGGADVHPGLQVPRKLGPTDYFGNISKVSIFLPSHLTPLTRV